MMKKYVKLNRTDIYAVYYIVEKVIYYNLNFSNKTQIIIFK
jgi:hypothetical protein